jgi:hypothetical protein
MSPLLKHGLVRPGLKLMPSLLFTIQRQSQQQALTWSVFYYRSKIQESSSGSLALSRLEAHNQGRGPRGVEWQLHR